MIFMVAGFLVAMTGLALWSLPLALVVGGTILFISGGLEHRNTRRSG